MKVELRTRYYRGTNLAWHVFHRYALYGINIRLLKNMTTIRASSSLNWIMWQAVIYHYVTINAFVSYSEFRPTDILIYKLFNEILVTAELFGKDIWKRQKNNMELDRTGWVTVTIWQLWCEY
jgi:hypothetical protein